ncbi:sensor histidine kinase [Microbacterium dauci]|uniref:histidine kinase n=1 Tax=Microbacterium dauci TaxID=3048008 RepID=A0ABT6ZH88_9MICO|nr:histidine kinase [Microbacterium sp. LX3-4]MDJ1115504.1 histidine kinase [Microbacterium sp. LX3-4]
MFRSLRRYQLLTDIGVGAVFALVALPLSVSMITSVSQLDGRIAVLAAALLTLVFSGALAIRRLSPPLALGIAWVAAIIQMALGFPPLFANVAILGVLYVTAAYGSRLVFWLGFASSLVGALAITVYLILPPVLAGGWSVESALRNFLVSGVMLFTASVFGLLLAWTVGALRRTGLRARETRAAQERAEAETAAEQERTRIARDMHDIVAHSLAVVIAQADGARYTKDADATDAALQTISTTARSALSDVRLLLTQLRHSQSDGPQPTLADLEQLYAQVRAAGVPLRVDVYPAPRGEVAASVELSVYRILQEALTNALRHGGGGPVDVSLAWHDDRVELAVRNAVSADAAPGSRPPGHGLIGMRERAQLIGGTLEAGADEGVFTVSAVLPTGAEAVR